jgi:uncharacterized protein with GYD domain
VRSICARQRRSHALIPGGCASKSVDYGSAEEQRVPAEPGLEGPIYRGRSPMPTYVLLVNYTDQGIRDVKDSPQRVDKTREIARRFGAEVKDVYLTMGNYDFVIPVDAPDDRAIAKLALSLGALGNIRTTTLRAFSESEFRELVKDLS